jgi:nitroimidazol reductase NimA-like FMN-containing flavoprotein (pyridoxamine 5'-phosphate oxidase superfamily)
MRLVTHENIPANECWELLQSEHLGRVALSVAALPAMVPVAYSVEGAESTISLDALQAMPTTAVDEAVIAFEVDTLDPQTHHGWIVHIVGTGRVSAPTKDGRDGDVRRVVNLVPAIITGQRL